MKPLIAYRKEHGITQRALAERLGTSPGYLHDIESGRRPPSLKFAVKIKDVTGLPLSVLLPEAFGEPASKAS